MLQLNHALGILKRAVLLCIMAPSMPGTSHQHPQQQQQQQGPESQHKHQSQKPLQQPQRQQQQQTNFAADGPVHLLDAAHQDLMKELVAVHTKLQCHLVQAAAAPATSDASTTQQIQHALPDEGSGVTSGAGRHGKAKRAALRTKSPASQGSPVDAPAHSKIPSGVVLPRAGLVQAPVALERGLMALFLADGFDLHSDTVTDVVVSELSSLQQLSTCGHRSDSPNCTIRSDNNCATHAAHAGTSAEDSQPFPGTGPQNFDIQAQTRQDDESSMSHTQASDMKPNLADLARDQARAAAEFLLRDLWTSETSPIQHAQVLAASAQYDAVIGSAASAPQLGRVKQAARLMDAELSKVSTLSSFPELSAGMIVTSMCAHSAAALLDLLIGRST